MTDIVERLRSDRTSTFCRNLMYEAADEIDRLRLDAARYHWLRERVFGADFSYGDGDETRCVLVFDIPDDMQVSGDLDRTLDAAMKL